MNLIYIHDTSPDSVRVLNELLIPEIIPLIRNIFHCTRLYKDVSGKFISKAVDIISYTLISSIFIDYPRYMTKSAQILKYFISEIYLSDDKYLYHKEIGNDWYEMVMAFDPQNVNEIICTLVTEVLFFKEFIELRIPIYKNNIVYDNFYGKIGMFIYDRRLKQEGTVYWVTNDNLGNEVKFFLFNDILIIGALGANNKYTCVYQMKLIEIEVEKYENVFLRITNCGKIIVFQCLSVEDCIRWYKIINELIKINKEEPYDYESIKLEEPTKNKKTKQHKDTKIFSNIPCISLDVISSIKIVDEPIINKITTFINTLIKNQTVSIYENEKLLNLIGLYIQLIEGDISDDSKNKIFNPEYIYHWKINKGLSYEKCLIRLLVLLNRLYPDWNNN